MDAPSPQPGPLPDAASAGPTPRQRRLLWNALTALAVVSLCGLALLSFYGFIAFLSWSYPLLLPIGLAVIIALVLEPIVNFVEKRGLARGTATLAVCVLSIILFLLFWVVFGNMLYTETSGFFQDLPGMLDKGVGLLDSSFTSAPDKSTNPTPPPSTNQLSTAQPPPPQKPEPPPAQPVPGPPASDHSELRAWMKTNLPSIEQAIQQNIGRLAYSALGPVGQAFGFLLGFGFVPIYVYYFLADHERISHRWHELVPMRRSPLRDEVVSVLTEINTSLVSYFRGQIVVAACNGVLTVIGLSLIGIPYSFLLGIITGALSIVPFLGIIASIIPALLLGFLSAKGNPTWQWLSPVLVLGVFALVQMSESMFITPRVQSHSTGLHPLAIILGILFWSLLLPGLLGPVVAVPLTCAVMVLLRRYVWQANSGENPPPA